MITLKCRQSLGGVTLELDTQIPQQGITAIFGRSGAGKTSLINLLSGLSVPDSGQINIGKVPVFDSALGVALPPEKRNIGYVFQDARLFPHMTVTKNLKYGQKRENPSLFEEVVALLDIGQLLTRYPKGLSGGEKQRVAIGRALLTEPGLLLMDEPLASLDGPRRSELMDYLLKMSASVKIPIVYVSHSLDEILQLADHMIMLHEGKVAVSGPLHKVWGSEPMRPWLSMKEQSSLITAKVIGKHPKYPLAELGLGENSLWVPDSGWGQGSDVRLRIFANDVSIVKNKPTQSSIRNVLACTVSQVRLVAHTSEPVSYTEVALRVGNDDLLANITQWASDELGLQAGDHVYAQVKGVNVTKNDVAQEHGY